MCTVSRVAAQSAIRTDLNAGRGPVTVLAEAVAADLITQEQSELVARTRLEGASLKRVAEQMGLSYMTARRRRVAAEQALAGALVTTKFEAG